MDVRPAPEPPVAWQGLLGYLNFSDGRRDPKFESQFHAAALLAATPAELADMLDRELAVLRDDGSAAFRDTSQAEVVIRSALRELPVQYRRHHADQLGHLPDSELFTPFFLAKACEAVLAARSSDGDADPIALAADALDRLNDFVGYRPVPVLETRAHVEYYDREKIRPLPIYLQGVGVMAGRYQAVLLEALRILRDARPDLLDDAQLDLDQIEELAVDPRPYDHNHPANRRPNHIFGEWDPHRVDNLGRYRRFVIRRCTVEELLRRVDEAGQSGPGLVPAAAGLPTEELFADAAAVLAGTILMAAALCGSGPNAHGSDVTLSTLVPRIAKLRDEFYEDLMTRQPPQRAERLRREQAATRQPFGSARQHLNQSLARERAYQVQERHLAVVFAALGYPRASRGRAANLDLPAVRLVSEARIRLTEVHRHAEQGPVERLPGLLAEAEAILHRGIRCGALIDPWNLLGFQGLYPLFQSREDTVHDPRAEELIGLVADLLDAYSVALCEAAVRGAAATRSALSRQLTDLAIWWDQFASYEVKDLRRVHAGEAAAAADHLADALAKWHQSDRPANALAFWRNHLDGFRTAGAFARVVGALLDRNDTVAAMGLLAAWLSETPDVPLTDGDASFHAAALRWTREVAEAHNAALLRKFIELLEVNAETYWEVPDLFSLSRPERRAAERDDEIEDTYGAAYEGVTFRDSADDGSEGSVIDDAPIGAAFELEDAVDQLRPRLQFLTTSAEIWRLAAGGTDDAAAVKPWLGAAIRRRDELLDFLDRLNAVPVPPPASGQFESAVEYDRRREIRETLLEETMAATLAHIRAVRTLSPGEEDDSSWEAMAAAVERDLRKGETAAVRAWLKVFVPSLRNEPLLYVPLSAGGHPRQILRTRSAQVMLVSLLEQLPRLGLFREAFQLTQTAQAMELNSPPEGRKVTEFDRLFPIGLQSSVEALLDAYARTPPPHHDLLDLLNALTGPYLKLWLRHSQSLRLSVLETVTDDKEWEQVEQFIRSFGRELFTPQFLNLANLRALLHRGVSAWLDDLDGRDAVPENLTAALGRTLPRDRAVRHLELILQAVAENYDEYRDYNSTTTQSDYGDNLYILLDFLKLKAVYDRDGWRLRPLLITHEVLCRRGRIDDAARWQSAILNYTKPQSEHHLTELGRLEARHGVRLRTVREKLSERFVAPLAIDRAAARLEPAWRAARAGADESHEAFTALASELSALAAEPVGGGLEVPAWIRRLERELNQLRRPTKPDPRPAPPPLDELRRQLTGDWADRDAV